MEKIIDSHTHVFPDKIARKAANGICDFYNFPRELGYEGTYEDLKLQSDKCGIKYLVICSTATVKEQVEPINSWISTLINEKTFALGTLHPDYENIEAETERIISLGLKGIKLHPDFQKFYADDEKVFPIYEAAQGRLPILIHSGDYRYDFSSPERIKNIAERFPKLDIIAAHLGGYSRWKDVKKHLLGRRVWFDTSSSLWFLNNDEAMDIIRSHGTDKIMFGTDYPISNAKRELDKLKELPLTKKEREDILFNTANSLYGFEK